MACWQVCNEQVTRWKVAACKHHNVPTVTGGGPFEVAVQQGQLPLYLDLVADFGFTRIEAGEGFTDMPLAPQHVVRLADERGLQDRARSTLVGCGRGAGGHRGPRECAGHRLLRR